MSTDLKSWANIVWLICLLIFLYVIKKKQGYLIPKKTSKKPKYWSWWVFPDYSAYPVPKIIEWIVKGIMIFCFIFIAGLVFYLLYFNVHIG